MNIATKVAHMGNYRRAQKNGNINNWQIHTSWNSFPWDLSLKELGPQYSFVFDALMQRIGDRNNPDRVSKHTKSHYWSQ